MVFCEEKTDISRLARWKRGVRLGSIGFDRGALRGAAGRAVGLNWMRIGGAVVRCGARGWGRAGGRGSTGQVDERVPSTSPSPE